MTLGLAAFCGSGSFAPTDIRRWPPTWRTARSNGLRAGPQIGDEIPAKFLLYNNQPHGIGGHWNQVYRMINELGWFDRYLRPESKISFNGGD